MRYIIIIISIILIASCEKKKDKYEEISHFKKVYIDNSLIFFGEKKDEKKIGIWDVFTNNSDTTLLYKEYFNENGDFLNERKFY